VKVVLAPNAFKGSLSAAQAAAAMAEGVVRACPGAEVVQVPVADGGDGLVEIARDVLAGERRQLLVSGPRFDLVSAEFCYLPERGLATIEMARASGLALLAPEDYAPLESTTFGTGELIRAALELGVEKISVGIGGSATNDGGIGMAAALGTRFLDRNGRAVRPVGGCLEDIVSFDLSGLDSRLAALRLEAVCDVDNPLLGPQGAARVYAPQKGASPEQVERLEAGMRHLAGLIESQLSVDVRTVAGGGAGGGLAAGLFAFLGADLRPGIDVVLDLVELDRHLAGADLVLTGEGRIDAQTLFGKAPLGVARRAQKKNIPCYALAGSLGDALQPLHEQGMDAVFSLCPGPISLPESMEGAARYLGRAAEQLLRCFLAARRS